MLTFVLQKKSRIYLPMHDVPFPVYPGLQVHVKDPMVFLQTAFTSQSCVPIAHSSISKKNSIAVNEKLKGVHPLY